MTLEALTEETLNQHDKNQSKASSKFASSIMKIISSSNQNMVCIFFCKKKLFNTNLCCFDNCIFVSLFFMKTIKEVGIIICIIFFI